MDLDNHRLVHPHTGVAVGGFVGYTANAYHLGCGIRLDPNYFLGGSCRVQGLANGCEKEKIQSP
jgi:hypothetical protein